MRLARSFVALLLLADAVVALDACGSRTGLLIDESDGTPSDAAADTEYDARDVRDAGPDVLPPIDANRPDVPKIVLCPDADATLIYLISQSGDLMSFYPPTAQFTTIGKIACPGGGEPFSMGVDRKGKAYVVFTDGRLYQVSTATAACVATPFAPNQNGFLDFGMGFAGLADGGESLFVAESPQAPATTSSGLAAIDLSTYKLGFIGPFSQTVERLELTGTGDGRLFGYAPSDSGSRIVQIDQLTGDVLAADPVAAGNGNDAFAFAFWGGDFWIFTGLSTTAVYRYAPFDKSTTFVATAPSLIVGAGVSTCAPQ